MIIDCISDLHGHFPKLEDGDLLIVAGDLTARDEEYEYDKFSQWLRSLAYKKVIVIGGNHDNYLFECKKVSVLPSFYRPTYVEYLCDSGTEFEGLKIWGSPWTQTFEEMNPQCKAFTLDTEKELDSKFSLIPDDTDILITHGPPFGILDTNSKGYLVGSCSLMAHHVKGLRPKLWVWGHIHEDYGEQEPDQWVKTKYVNCSHVNERYEPVNKPIRIVL